MRSALILNLATAACLIGMAHAATAASKGKVTICQCQAALFCGADSCAVENPDYCVNSDISFVASPPAINFCIGQDCMSGPATMSRPRDDEIWLHGKFRHSAAPDQNPTSVSLLLNQATGIGMIQTADEQGVDQVSIICVIEAGQ